MKLVVSDSASSRMRSFPVAVGPKPVVFYGGMAYSLRGSAPR